MSLSDKIMFGHTRPSIILTKDVKEFIKELKGVLPQFIEKNLEMKPSEKMILFGKFCKEIDKLAGEKLIHSPRVKLLDKEPEDSSLPLIESGSDICKNCGHDENEGAHQDVKLHDYHKFEPKNKGCKNCGEERDMHVSGNCKKFEPENDICKNCGHDRKRHKGNTIGHKFQSCDAIACLCKKFEPENKGCGKYIEQDFPKMSYECNEYILCPKCSGEGK